MDFGCQCTCKNHLLAAFPIVLSQQSIYTETSCWSGKNPPVSAGYTDSTPGPGTAHLPQRSPWSRAVLGTYRVAPALHRYSKPTHSNGDPVQTKMFTLSTILSKCAFCNGSVF